MLGKPIASADINNYCTHLCKDKCHPCKKETEKRSSCTPYCRYLYIKNIMYKVFHILPRIKQKIYVSCKVYFNLIKCTFTSSCHFLPFLFFTAFELFLPPTYKYNYCFEVEIIIFYYIYLHELIFC